MPGSASKTIVIKAMSCVVLPSLFLIACVSAPKIDQAIHLTRDGQYQEAEQALKNAIPEQGKNRLLHHLELGMINHLQGDYNASNHYFNQAEQIIERAYTISLSDELATLFTGPSLSSYQSPAYETTFINYYKALNYLKLTEQVHNQELSESDLDPALVEIRRLTHRLEQQKLKTGGYKPNNKSNSQLSDKVLSILMQILGEPKQSQRLQYRDDAYGHYISGLLFELAGNTDNARISYQRAATSYKNGFAEQYQLGSPVIQQAWYDVARTMKLDGDNDWQNIAKKHLNTQRQQQLDTASPEDAELVVLQHIGLMPKRESLELRLTIDSYSKSLVLWPVPTGTKEQRQAQMAWFLILYSDTSPFDIIQNYMVGDLSTVISGIISKRIPIGMLWHDVKRLNLIKALEFGARVSIPYYPPIKNHVRKSEIYINGTASGDLIAAEAINRIALQEQIKQSNREIQIALARELTKAITAQQTADSSNPALGGLLKFINLFTASADTRNWLTLPSGINFIRTKLPAGSNEIMLKTTLNNGLVIKQQQTLNVTPGRPTLWSTRTLEPSGIAAKPL